MDHAANTNQATGSSPSDDVSPNKQTSSLGAHDKPLFIHEEGKVVRKA